MDPLKDIAKEIKAARSSALLASSLQQIELLTDEEIDELRILISGREAEMARFESVKDDEKHKGMYVQFGDLGLVSCILFADGGIGYYGHLPKAVWAVAHHDRRAEESRQRAEAEERRHRETLKSSRWNMVVGWALGMLSSAILASLPYIWEAALTLPEALGS